MTNYERIKTMTFEEMVDFLERYHDDDIDVAKTFCELCDHSTDCDDCTKWWLGLDSKEHPQGLDYWSGT